MVVVDELHLISDSHRGYLLELLLTKLLLHGHIRKQRQLQPPPGPTAQDDDQNIQIVGMSATLSNLPVLASWLQAAIYTTDFRPIPLTEVVYSKDHVYLVKPGESGSTE